MPDDFKEPEFYFVANGNANWQVFPELGKGEWHCAPLDTNGAPQWTDAGPIDDRIDEEIWNFYENISAYWQAIKTCYLQQKEQVDLWPLQHALHAALDLRVGKTVKTDLGHVIEFRIDNIRFHLSWAIDAPVGQAADAVLLAFDNPDDEGEWSQSVMSNARNAFPAKIAGWLATKIQQRINTGQLN